MIKLILINFTLLFTFIIPTNADELFLDFKLKSNQIYYGEPLHIVEKIHNGGKEDIRVNFTSFERWLYLVGYYPQNPPYWLPDNWIDKRDNNIRSKAAPFAVLRKAYSVFSKDTSGAEGWFHLIFTESNIQTIQSGKEKKPSRSLAEYKLKFPYPGIYLLNVEWGNSLPRDEMGYISGQIFINVLPSSDVTQGKQKIQIIFPYPADS